MNKKEMEEAIDYFKNAHIDYSNVESGGIAERVCNMAISALTQQLNNGWIPVTSGHLPSIEERQNEYGVPTPLRVAINSKEYRAYFDGKEWSDTFTGEVLYGVKAWCQLPQPYKEGKDAERN